VERTGWKSLVRWISWGRTKEKWLEENSNKGNEKQEYREYLPVDNKVTSNDDRSGLIKTGNEEPLSWDPHPNSGGSSLPLSLFFLNKLSCFTLKKKHKQWGRGSVFKWKHLGTGRQLQHRGTVGDLV
jgi:hypothetical protein